jgi:hypothetical protein
MEVDAAIFQVDAVVVGLVLHFKLLVATVKIEMPLL